KAEAVFRKRSCSNKRLERTPDAQKNHAPVALEKRRPPPYLLKAKQGGDHSIGAAPCRNIRRKRPTGRAISPTHDRGAGSGNPGRSCANQRSGGLRACVSSVAPELCKRNRPPSGGRIRSSLFPTIAHMEHCMALSTTLTINGVTRTIALDDPRV